MHLNYINDCFIFQVKKESVVKHYCSFVASEIKTKDDLLQILIDKGILDVTFIRTETTYGTEFKTNWFMEYNNQEVKCSTDLKKELEARYLEAFSVKRNAKFKDIKGALKIDEPEFPEREKPLFKPNLFIRFLYGIFTKDKT